MQANRTSHSRHTRGSVSRGVRTERYKLIHFFLPPEEWELYDLKTDPNEATNLYGRPEYAELTADMKTRLDALRKETSDTFEYKPTGIAAHSSLGGAEFNLPKK